MISCTVPIMRSNHPRDISTTISTIKITRDCRSGLYRSRCNITTNLCPIHKKIHCSSSRHNFNLVRGTYCQSFACPEGIALTCQSGFMWYCHSDLSISHRNIPRTTAATRPSTHQNSLRPGERRRSNCCCKSPVLWKKNCVRDGGSCSFAVCYVVRIVYKIAYRYSSKSRIFANTFAIDVRSITVTIF